MSEYQGWDRITDNDDCPSPVCIASRKTYLTGGSIGRDGMTATERAAQNLVANQQHNGAPNGCVWNGREWIPASEVGYMPDGNWQEQRDLPSGSSHQALPGSDRQALPSGERHGGLLSWLFGVHTHKER